MISVVPESLTVGMVFVGPAVGWIWAAVNLRSNVIDKYQEKLPWTRAALDEQAAKWMRKLSDDIGKLLGGPGGQFDPDQALALPGVLRAEMEHVDRLLRARETVGRYHAWLRRIGPMLSVLGVVYLASAAVAVMYYAEITRWRSGGELALRIAVVAVALAALLVLLYWFLSHRFDSARVLSSKEPAQ